MNIRSVFEEIVVFGSSPLAFLFLKVGIMGRRSRGCVGALLSPLLPHLFDLFYLLVIRIPLE
jgi:hypothetical protein